MLATINHNFNLFRNYISSIKKKYSSELNKELTFSIDEAREEDRIDTITMDVPLFIRALEYAKEDAQEDMDLHDLAEKAIAGTLEKGTLTMDDYDMLTGNVKPVDEDKADSQRRREEMINKMMGEVKNKKGGLWANINAKQARGEKPSHGNSKAFKDAVKAGEKLHKTKK
jgi:hypothetical protein